MRSRYITITVAVLLGVLLSLPVRVDARTKEVSATTAALNPDQASVTATGTFSYTVYVLPASAADSISARFELFSHGGRSIYLRTKYWTFNGDSANVTQERPDAEGRYSYTFTHDLSNLDLPLGRYEVRCTIRTSTPEKATVQRLESSLFVYDPTGAPTPVALVVRVGAPPLRRADGDFASDPATGTARLRAEELDRLAHGVLIDPRVRLAIAPSPLLLEELADIADGCRYLDKTGTPVELTATSAPARYAAQVLSSLRKAIATGRLEVAWQGYADPNVSALLEYQLTDDLQVQYNMGAQVLQGTLGVKPAPITAPYGDRTVMQASKALKDLGMTRVLPASHNKVSQSLETSGLAEAQTPLFDLRGEDGATPVVVGLPEQHAEASALMDRIEALQTCAWIDLQMPSTAKLRDPLGDPGSGHLYYEAPHQDFLAVRQARVGALGLESAASSKDPDAVEALRLSLIAENAFGPRPSVSGADQSIPASIDYTEAVEQIVGKAFSVLKLKTHPVTLAGSTGEVPITVVNSGATQMKVNLEFSSPKDGLTVKPKRSPSLTVASNDTLFSPQVTLRKTGVNDLRVRLLAGEYVVCEDSVAISGSYLDVIGIVAIVVIIGAGLVIYIWRHSRNLQKGEARAS